VFFFFFFKKISKIYLNLETNMYSTHKTG